MNETTAGVTISLSELIQKYPSLSLAEQAHNQEILDFIAHIPMQTQEGGLSFDRNPDFFALTRAQGEKAYTFLFRNPDHRLAGLGCVSIIPMSVQGESRYLGYTSDLRLSPQIDRSTRLEFYKFYEELIQNFANLAEFNYCRHIFATIFDGNLPARRALVEKKNNPRSQLIHRPVFSYENINVLGKIPGFNKFARLKKVDKASSLDQEEIVSFLTQSSPQQSLTWTESEVLRRLKVCGLGFQDFLLIRNKKGQIVATTLLMSDQAFRRVKINRIPFSVKVSQLLMPLLGQPNIELEKPLNIGHLCFFKVQPGHDISRSLALSSFLNVLFSHMQKIPRDKRYHSITLQEPQHTGLMRKLRRRGFLCVALPSTLYQVYHEKNAHSDLLLPASTERPDFDFVFH